MTIGGADAQVLRMVHVADRVLGARFFEVHGGVDEADVAERLGEVAQKLPGSRIDLLREQTEVVPVREKTLEELPRAGKVAGESEVVDEPPATDHECTLVPADTVVAVDVAIHETFRRELSRRPFNGGPHARVTGRQEADEWDEQVRSIERGRPERLNKCPAGRVDSVGLHAPTNLRAHALPARKIGLEAERASEANAAVHRHPGHHL